MIVSPNILNNIIYIYMYGITWVCLWKLEDLPPICGQSTGENHDQAVDTMIYGYPVCRQTHIWMSKHHERSGSHYLCTWPPQVLTLGFKSPIFKRIQVCESVSVGVHFPEIKVGHFQNSFKATNRWFSQNMARFFGRFLQWGGHPNFPWHLVSLSTSGDTTPRRKALAWSGRLWLKMVLPMAIKNSGNEHNKPSNFNFLGYPIFRQTQIIKLVCCPRYLIINPIKHH